MNVSIIRYILGWVLRIEAVFLLLPCVTALIYRENVGIYYLAVSVICIIMGWLMSHKKPHNSLFLLKEGCVATALSWIFLSLFGCIPLYISGEIPSFTDALFETISGFTTTGATILADIEALSHTALIWRSFTHWIGGMGVLVFLLAIIPLSGGSHINLMRAESPGPSVGKLVPNIKTTARLLYSIYFGFTVLEVILLVCGACPLFDAVTISFGTAGTGGFAIKNDSLTSYSPYIQWVVTIFMLLFGVNFNAYYFILFRKFKKAAGMEEVKAYFGIILASIIIIFLNIFKYAKPAGTLFRDAAFQVASIITTTGYSTVDFDLWPETSKTIIVLLMFIGACAGSTGGGIKVSRIVILLKTLSKEISSYIYPRSIKKIKMEGKTVAHDVVRSTNVYFITYFIIFSFSVLLISFEGKDAVTNFTAVATMINNVGPGLELVGPTCNFGIFNVFSKYILMFDMLAGRLELFPLLILVHPNIIKSMVVCRKSNKRIKNV